MSAHRITATLVRCALVITLATAAAPGTLLAQAGGGAVPTSAEILPPPVTGTGMQQLDFGEVTLGQAVDVPPGPAGTGASTSSAGWHFGNIRKGRWVSLTLTLPATLRRGTYSIPLNWNNADYGLLCVSGSSGVCAMTGSFNPGSWPSLQFQISSSLPGTNFDVRLYVGARIQVPAQLPPGVYAATVTAVFAYVN
jgi:spore coat protein U-like protein